VARFSAYKIWGCSTRETFLILRLNGGDKKCAFLTGNWSYLGNGER